MADLVVASKGGRFPEGIQPGKRGQRCRAPLGPEALGASQLAEVSGARFVVHGGFPGVRSFPLFAVQGGLPLVRGGFPASP